MQESMKLCILFQHGGMPQDTVHRPHLISSKQQQSLALLCWYGRLHVGILHNKHVWNKCQHVLTSFSTSELFLHVIHPAYWSKRRLTTSKHAPVSPWDSFKGCHMIFHACRDILHKNIQGIPGKSVPTSWHHSIYKNKHNMVASSMHSRSWHQILDARPFPPTCFL